MQPSRVNGSVGRARVARQALTGLCTGGPVACGAAGEPLAIAMLHAGVLREPSLWYVKKSSRLPSRLFTFGAGAVFINTNSVYPPGCSTHSYA